MRKIIFITAFTLGTAFTGCILPGCSSHNGRQADTGDEIMNILLVTGGHSFDQDSFFRMFFSLKGLCVDTLSQPRANSALLSDPVTRYDAIVFYDMWQEISPEEKEAYLALTEWGTGLVFLHHSLVSYQEWDEFTAIRGGKYYESGYDYPPEKLSGYRHDIFMDVTVIDTSHPVTEGLENFRIFDEGYSNIGVLPGVTPLLTTDHPDCHDIIAWAHTYNSSRVVYILPGHDRHAWENENYQALVANSIRWSAGRDRDGR
ncbi:MAG: ThuA domain-containing protein [Marinilabiliales bacterium]|nr:MAG: ThuA domain-containing protein [Marinilabiliales bacterium]